MAKLEDLENDIVLLDAQIAKLRAELERKRLEYDAMLETIIRRRDTARIRRSCGGAQVNDGEAERG